MRGAQASLAFPAFARTQFESHCGGAACPICAAGCTPPGVAFGGETGCE
jgi:hypothetical protein